MEHVHLSCLCLVSRLPRNRYFHLFPQKINHFGSFRLSKWTIKILNVSLCKFFIPLHKLLSSGKLKFLHYFYYILGISNKMFLISFTPFLHTYRLNRLLSCKFIAEKKKVPINIQKSIYIFIHFCDNNF